MAKQSVIIIGGGVTGCAAAHDLALRGLDVTVVERGELASATTGRCSCFLHSGARYAVKDPHGAQECISENEIMRRIMPPMTMEENDGIFVLLGEDDPDYVDPWFEGCAAVGIEAKEISLQELWAREPNLSRDIRRAAIIPDAIVEPLRYTLSFAATAQQNGAKFHRFTNVRELLMEGNRVVGVKAEDRVTGELLELRADLVLNATGPWANRIAELIDIEIPLALSPGVHVMIGRRLVNFVTNRMHSPGSGDFVAPQRQTVILGTSSWSIEDCDFLEVRWDHVYDMIEETAKLIPAIKDFPIHSVNAAVRPLIASGGASERDLSRGFSAFDHAPRDNVEGFVSISGGKLITARLMAEKISDLVCKKLDIKDPCQTHTYPLVSFRRFYMN
jgi:glycerol-3-phosphate dehydrogenase